MTIHTCARPECARPLDGRYWSLLVPRTNLSISVCRNDDTCRDWQRAQRADSPVVRAALGGNGTGNKQLKVRSKRQ